MKNSQILTPNRREIKRKEIFEKAVQLKNQEIESLRRKLDQKEKDRQSNYQRRKLKIRKELQEKSTRMSIKRRS